MEIINIDTEFIKLDQLLKFANIAQTGGHGKMIINDGMVKLNGEVCTQRGRKIRNNDEIQVDGVGSYKISSAI